jgi:hypothetical protein
MPAAPPPVKRTCGTCTLCCKATAVFELRKPTGEWCAHCTAATGAAGKGCGVYETRPYECRAFECLWLQGLLPERDRPDDLHAVLYAQATADPDRPLVVVAEAYPGAAARNPRLATLLAGILRRGHPVDVRNAEYIDRHRPGHPVRRIPINAADRLRVVGVNENPAAFEAQMEQLLREKTAAPPAPQGDRSPA